ncbi:unnamed protein product [Rotaria sordida]|uniref:EF-hand domain-containing protein n=1 Tax=Rotaria sordida TaxID=392033 RepID=A0A814IAP0_9BILA|nr:unnamed protein product [Rotaria sordida]CAF1134537.1 unnamed protein product [Rotaria sordida]
MASFDTAKAIFAQADRNRDESINKNEFYNWISNVEGLTSSSYESSTNGLNLNDNTSSRFDQYKYKVSSQNAWDFTTDKYTPYGTTTAAASRSINDAVIHTNSLEETNQYLEKLANNIYKDPNPQIIRRATTEAPVSHEQRVFVRYLQPPAVPSPGPLIIKEVRPEQPPPPPPIIIRQHAPPLPALPPLILRERPPTPPAYIPSETVTHCLPAISVSPPSIVIKYFQPLPEKSHNIIIERWIPYEPQTQRRTIIQRARFTIKYLQPSYTVAGYEVVPMHIVRKFEKLCVPKENPNDYVTRYGTPLLDSATLVQQARNAGVVEDISLQVRASSINTNARRNTVDFDRSNRIINRAFSSSGATSSEGIQLNTGREAINLGDTSYSSSVSKFIGASASAGSVNAAQGRFHVGDNSLIATDTNRNRKLNQTEFQIYI